jgi:hypothetical protein
VELNVEDVEEVVEEVKVELNVEEVKVELNV